MLKMLPIMMTTIFFLYFTILSRSCFGEIQLFEVVLMGDDGYSESLVASNFSISPNSREENLQVAIDTFCVRYHIGASDCFNTFNYYALKLHVRIKLRRLHHSFYFAINVLTDIDVNRLITEASFAGSLLVFK